MAVMELVFKFLLSVGVFMLLVQLLRLVVQSESIEAHKKDSIR